MRGFTRPKDEVALGGCGLCCFSKEVVFARCGVSHIFSRKAVKNIRLLLMPTSQCETKTNTLKTPKTSRWSLPKRWCKRCHLLPLKTPFRGALPPHLPLFPAFIWRAPLGDVGVVLGIRAVPEHEWNYMLVSVVVVGPCFSSCL